MLGRLLRVCAVTWSLLVPVGQVAAEVVRVVVDRREILLDGRPFGDAGAYEKLTGRILFAFDPDDPANAAVVDLDLAPRGDDGLVEVWSEFVVLQPVDASLRRGVAWVDVGEGGFGRSLTLLHGASLPSADPRSEAELGDALLLDEGLTLIWVGWEAVPPTIPGGLVLPAPIAHEADGAPVVGWVRVDWRVEAETGRLDLAGPGQAPYAVVVPDAPVHLLTVRSALDGPRDTIPREEWDFVLAGDGPIAGRPEAITLQGGFEEGRIYELVYRAQDPRVGGLGLAVVRDVMAYARYDLQSEFPTDAGIAFGVEGGARFLRQFLRQGFNVDETGRAVFDGVWMHAAGAGRGAHNVRFSHLEGVRPEHPAFLEPTEVFPFSHAVQFDPVTGLNEGLLDRLEVSAIPRTFTTHLGSDYLFRGAALTHTSIDGLRDLPVDGDHRAYHLASTSRLPDSLAEIRGADQRPTLRALASAMTAWIADDATPPDSRLPAVGEGTLVPSRGVSYPSLVRSGEIPEVRPIYRADHGPRFSTDGIADREPPTLGLAYPAQVPQVDGVGNELGGVRGLDVRVPLATYLPWDSEGAVPLPLTPAEQQASGDSRPTIQHLYGSEAGFLARVRAAVEALVAEGFLLERDREAAVAAARRRWLRLTSG